jgi:hypothetical protein
MRKNFNQDGKANIQNDI